MCKLANIHNFCVKLSSFLSDVFSVAYLLQFNVFSAMFLFKVLNYLM